MHLKKLSLTISVALCLVLTACNKEELKQDSKNSVDTKSVAGEPAALKKFLSVILNVPQDVILYDKEKKNFYIPNTVFLESYDTIKYRYEEANEYKLNNPD
ncbi:hypothetical protein HDF26_003161 [Pedobacter cryoconitis]|uniref:hypothetical protein n=1 Tax=Pedobacter cryoconitis TaxID=188932 RepID=UPI00160CAB22|nr:hypothetical protein [Pedobacter cryoconitis]MBB6272704.1 hypothetical protein [Pedobacter cryoconitis]